MSTNGKLLRKFWDKLDDSPFVMIGSPDDASSHHEPMTAYFDESLPNRLFIYLAKDNRLCEALAEGKSDVSVHFISKGHDFFACLHGTLSRVEDDKLIDKFWTNTVEAWFDEGRQDARLAMVEVDLETAEMWEAKVSAKGKFEMMFGGTIDKDDMRQQHSQLSL